jgi:hypothetical protein
MPLRGRKGAMALLLFLGLVMGCGGSRQEQARKLDQERASWEATARLTDKLSEGGALPPVYRRQVLQKSAENLQKIRQQKKQLSQ